MAGRAGDPAVREAGLRTVKAVSVDRGTVQADQAVVARADAVVPAVPVTQEGATTVPSNDRDSIKQAFDY